MIIEPFEAITYHSEGKLLKPMHLLTALLTVLLLPHQAKAKTNLIHFPANTELILIVLIRYSGLHDQTSMFQFPLSKTHIHTRTEYFCLTVFIEKWIIVITFLRVSCAFALFLPLQTSLGSRKLSKASASKSVCILFTERENITNFF